MGPLYENDEIAFEELNFFKEVSSDLSELRTVDTSNINLAENLELLRRLKPDLGVVFGTRKIDASIIACFKDGLLNVHRGIAEQYRGLDSDLWAIYHADYSNIGVTIHLVANQLDTGAIVRQQRLTLKKDMKIWQLRYYTTVIATDLMCSAVSDYLEKRLVSREQESLGRYYSFMPLCLKEICSKKFNKFCGQLHG